MLNLSEVSRGEHSSADLRIKTVSGAVHATWFCLPRGKVKVKINWDFLVKSGLDF